MYLSPSIAQAELRTLARGQRSHVPVKVLAEYILNYGTRDAAPTPEPSNDDSRAFLERMYSLTDSRHA